MGMASDKGIKVILGGQGADEIFFGYDSLVKPILANQFKNLDWLLFFKNLGEIKIAPSSKIRLLVSALLPKFEKIVAQKLRSGRNQKVQQKLGWEKFNTSFIQADQNNRHQVWEETTKGIHLPHLVHYDDRNGMSKGVEGRMPFLDHRIAETLAKIRWSEFIKNGQRKYLLREACRDYLPKVLYNRKDKIGFYTPLSENLNSAKIHLTDRFSKNINLNNKILTANFIELINNKEHNYLEILYLWRIICILIWEEEFRINLR
jgi:asparagine synthase (glutamine-hydrolysing)